MSFTFATKVTIFRILAVPFFILSVLYYAPGKDYLRFVALGIFLLAVGSDIFDGYIARRWEQRSPAGVLLDPLADKLLLMSAFLCLYLIGPQLPHIRFPLWLVIAVICRDVILLIGAGLILIFHNGQFSAQATRWGKISTFAQCCAVIWLLLQGPMAMAVWIPALAFTVVSGTDYLFRGMRLLNDPHKETLRAPDFVREPVEH
ncbi:MAG: CDP-alcohol phosphatidyltransferase family protein [Candidatus Omnitrophota bacterium]|nr:CDP-alcohol phosphatidyltransferase family protein [Candidatus Omnitrophota bacterium]